MFTLRDKGVSNSYNNICILVFLCMLPTGHRTYEPVTVVMKMNTTDEVSCCVHFALTDISIVGLYFSRAIIIYTLIFVWLLTWLFRITMAMVCYNGSA